MLKFVKRVFIQFNPTDPKASSARELLQRVGCDKARASNPSCVVEFKVQDEDLPGKAFVELTFIDDDTRKVTTADKKVQDVVKLIHEKATEMEMKEVLQEVGINPWKQTGKLATAKASR